MTEEISKAALPTVNDLAIASSALTHKGGGVWQVDLVVAGRPLRIKRFREGLTRTKAVRQPILGEDCMVRFTFKARDDETPLTTATWVIIDAMQASALPAMEAIEESSTRITSTGALPTSGRRTTSRPRRRMPVTQHRR